jgi:hypothetical protein
MMMMTKKELQDAGTALLKEHGCNWDGRKSDEVSSKQTSHDLGMISVPTGGKVQK